MQPVACQATNGLVVDLRRAVFEVWKARKDDIIAVCAPHVPTGLVDEMDLIGWLIADALGQPLLHPDDTNAVGKRVGAVSDHGKPRPMEGPQKKKWHVQWLIYMQCEPLWV